MKFRHAPARNQGLVSVVRLVPTGSRLPSRTRRARQRARRPWWMRWIPVGLGLVLLPLGPPRACAQGPDSVTVRWTAPGDDGRIGTASVYQLRFSDSPIDAGNFAAAILVAATSAPRPAGSSESVTVRGLVRGTPYWFAIRTQDDAGNWSGLSNVLMWDWNLDTAPPAAPGGLTAGYEGKSVRVQWSPNAEADLAGYSVYRALSASGPYAELTTGLVTSNVFVDDAVPDGAENLWYRVTASDVNGNEGAPSGAFQLSPVVAKTDAWTVEPAFPNPGHLGDPVNVPVVIPNGGNSNAVLDVLDSGGRRVRRIELGGMAPGRQTVVWDGRNDAGASVVPGTYRAWLIAGATRSSIVLLRVP